MPNLTPNGSLLNPTTLTVPAVKYKSQSSQLSNPPLPVCSSLRIQVLSLRIKIKKLLSLVRFQCFKHNTTKTINILF
jgi:hypothetical protein